MMQNEHGGTPLYPLRFQPIFKQLIWGGRQLGSLLGKEIGGGDDYAESWEIVDHGEDQSVVTDGPLAGMTLNQLVRTRGEELLGSLAPLWQFPMLYKFLDAQRILSVQVHPNDQQAAQLTPPDAGKTEAWIVLATGPESVIYAGVKSGVDRAALADAVAQGRTHECLHSFSPAVGDCIFIPAGTAHAFGNGMLVAEIQQSSDTTFRLFDWNRVDANGQSRELHIEQALDAIRYDFGPVGPVSPEILPEGVERLVECEYFTLDRHRDVALETIGGDARFHLLAILEGELTVAGDPAERPLKRGETMLLPASLDSVDIEKAPGTVLLDISPGR